MIIIPESSVAQAFMTRRLVNYRAVTGSNWVPHGQSQKRTKISIGKD